MASDLYSDFTSAILQMAGEVDSLLRPRRSEASPRAQDAARLLPRPNAAPPPDTLFFPEAHPRTSCIGENPMVASSRCVPATDATLRDSAPLETKSSASTIRGPSEPMNRFEGKVFENEHVVLDEGVYVNCKFKEL